MDQGDKWVGAIYVEDKLELHWEGVALSEIEKTTIDVDPVYDPLYKLYLSFGIEDLNPQSFIRSSIVKINVFSDESELEYSKPITLHLRTDITAPMTGRNKIYKKVS